MVRMIEGRDFVAARKARKEAEAEARERARRRRRNVEDAVMAVVAFGPGVFFFAGFAWGVLKWAFGL